MRSNCANGRGTRKAFVILLFTGTVFGKFIECFQGRYSFPLHFTHCWTYSRLTFNLVWANYWLTFSCLLWLNNLLGYFLCGPSYYGTRNSKLVTGVCGGLFWNFQWDCVRSQKNTDTTKPWGSCITCPSSEATNHDSEILLCYIIHVFARNKLAGSDASC